MIAGGAVLASMLIPAVRRSASAYGGDAGTLRLLVDLLLFTCLFLLPAWRRGGGEASSHALVVVVFTGIVAVLVLSRLARTPIEDLVRLVGFLTLVSLAADLCTAALSRYRGIYYAVAGFLSFGVPISRFFCYELFGIAVRPVDLLSPFVAAHVVLQPDESLPFWPAWVFFGALAAAAGFVAVLGAWRSRT